MSQGGNGEGNGAGEDIYALCERLSLEQRSLYLPNARCEVRGVPNLFQGTYRVTYHQVPGFVAQQPHDTGRRLPEDVTTIVYQTVRDSSPWPVLVPGSFLSREDNGS